MKGLQSNELNELGKESNLKIYQTFIKWCFPSKCLSIIESPHLFFNIFSMPSPSGGS